MNNSWIEKLSEKILQEVANNTEDFTKWSNVYDKFIKYVGKEPTYRHGVDWVPYGMGEIPRFYDEEVSEMDGYFIIVFPAEEGDEEIDFLKDDGFRMDIQMLLNPIPTRIIRAWCEDNDEFSDIHVTNFKILSHEFVEKDGEKYNRVVVLPLEYEF